MRCAVVGAGPAGLMAAEIIARAGHSVALYDRMPSPGRKLLIAGRGGLNLTHNEPLEALLARYGAATPHITPAIRSFSPQDLVQWADALGAATFVGTSGRVFPKALKASPLLRAWLARLNQLGVELHLRHGWIGWSPEGGLAFETQSTDSMPGSASAHVCHPDVTVLALGGASWPRLGSDGGWVQILRAAGVGVRELLPANAGCHIAWSDFFRTRFEGRPLKRIAVTVGSSSTRGDAVVTREGLESGAIYALNPEIRNLLAATGTAQLQIDLRPDIPVDGLADRLSRPRGKQSLANALRKHAALAPEAIALLHEARPAGLPREAGELAALVKALPLTITGLAGLARAISSAGGVAFSEVSEQFMLLKCPGVFVAGEMLDWEAPTGGYLLQATFSTGVAAGRGAIAWLEAQNRATPVDARPPNA